MKKDEMACPVARTEEIRTAYKIIIREKVEETAREPLAQMGD
jgi:hypothetical protein